MQAQLLNGGQYCSVCGIGACFASAVRLSNDSYVKDHYGIKNLIGSDDVNFDSKLRQFFDERQIHLIEYSYERSGKGREDEISPDDKKASQFGCRYESDTDRMLAILQSIADHPEGLFVP